MRRFAALAFLVVAPPAHADPLPTADGFRGIWYMNQPTKDEYGYKYSGGMATYPQQHAPIAVYAKAVDKTFFVYGGVAAFPPAKPSLLHCVAAFDHATGTVSRPRVLLDKKTDDAHDNPVIQLDDAGHLWVFSPAHGLGRPAFVHRSTKPYSIDEFEKVWETNFSYTQPWHVPGKGFLFLHTKYGDGAARGLRFATSPDGRQWSDPTALAAIEMGDYQISWRTGTTVGTAFDFHPKPVGLNARTKLYYLQTADFGATWTTAAGKEVKLPLTTPANPALVRDYRAEKKLVYVKDLNFDAAGRPVLMYLTTDGHEPGPKGGKREWFTSRWTGDAWDIRPFTASDHNYDHGSLYVEADGKWRVIAPTDPGPQPHGTGGEMVLWESADQGTSWKWAKTLTANSPRNQSYARRPLNAHPGFYALWADGNPFQPSESHLYFCTAEGKVYRLPAAGMVADGAAPVAVPVE